MNMLDVCKDIELLFKMHMLLPAVYVMGGCRIKSIGVRKMWFKETVFFFI